jgi:16S rRNA (uracil1498-N3)-methyltransferase
MRRRFLADELHGSTAVLTGQNAAHLARVLRARVGQEYEIAGEGSVRIGKITIIEDDRIEFELGEAIESKQLVPITLIAAIFKFDRFEWAIEKATELGVARIVPVVARRTDAHLAKSADKRVERWRRIAHEASQQSRRTGPPEIAEPIRLKDALANQSGVNILLSEAESDRSLRSALEGSHADSIALAIGPEGGWTEDELQLFESAGWTSASLGPTILRAETAVVAGLAVVRAMMTGH